MISYIAAFSNPLAAYGKGGTGRVIAKEEEVIVNVEVAAMVVVW